MDWPNFHFKFCKKHSIILSNVDYSEKLKILLHTALGMVLVQQDSQTEIKY